MRDAPRAGSRWWAVGEWSLRWKVTAIVAIPLGVAVALGSVRVTSELADADNLREVSANIDVVPDVTNLTAVLGAVAGGQATGTLQQQDVDSANKVIANIEQLRATRPLGAVRVELDDMLATAKTIVADGRNPAITVNQQRDRAYRIRDDAVKVIDGVVNPSSSALVHESQTLLVDSINARAQLFDELVAIIQMMQESAKKQAELAASGTASSRSESAKAEAAKVSDTDFLRAASAERAQLTVLGRHFHGDDPTIAKLNRDIDARTSMVKNADNVSELPVPALRTSLLDSVATYNKVGSAAMADITNTVRDLYDQKRAAAVRDSVILAAVLILEVVLAALAARSLLVPLRRMRAAAQQMADRDLPAEIDRVKDGAGVEDVVPTPMPVQTQEEVGQLARAIDNIHDQALRLAGEQAQLRLQMADMFETLARRSKSLVDHQLGLIEAMEYEEKDPKLLEGLFRLDHLAARMRRNSDNLLILAGTKARRTKAAPVEIGDVLRAAISEVEEYQRVKLGATPRGALTEPAASDIAHLFAELLDNALRASPPETDVKFTFAQANDQGLLIEVADRGIGVPPNDLSMINKRLEAGAEVSADTARHMGLFVVSRLAERHGLTVRMRPTFDIARDPGVTVTVHVPRELILGGSVLAGGVKAPPVAPQRSMESSPIKSVTRTAGGNMMVTVDTASPMSRPNLPQRQPGGSILPPVPEPAGQLAARGSLIGEGLPQRRPGTSSFMRNGLPQRQPQSELSAGDDTREHSDEPLSLLGPPPLEEVQSVEDTAITNTGGWTLAFEDSSGPIPLPTYEPEPEAPTTGEWRLEAAAPESPPELPMRRPMREPDPEPAPTLLEQDVAAPVYEPPRIPGRHVRSADPARTAAFFQSRLKPSLEDTSGIPIFAEMMSGWLADWQEGMPRPAFESIADEGWSAAQRVAEARPTQVTESGLPQRNPGARLIPGAVAREPERPARARPEPVPADVGSHRRRDPETVRASLARHQAGVRNGRAQSGGGDSGGRGPAQGSTMMSTGDEGER